MQFHILGPVGLEIGGQMVQLGATKVRGVLGILLLSPNTPVAVSTLERRLWDEPARSITGQKPVKGRDLPPNPYKTLQIYVTRLRAALKEANSPATLTTESRAYRLNVDPAIVDYHRFRALAAEGRRAAQQGDQDRAGTAFAAAIDLWQGPPLADLTTAWAQAQRDTLVNQDLLPAWYGLIDADLALGRHELARERLRPLLREHDTDETLAGQWMRAIAVVDGPDKLPGFFRAFSERVRAALDTDPGEQLVRLYDRLTRHEPPTMAAIAPANRKPRPTPRLLPRPTPYFTGREDVLSHLDTLLLHTDSPPVVAIDGPPGIGKSALVAHWASRHPFPTGTLYADLSGHSLTEPVAPAAVLTAFLGALDVPPDHVPSDVRAQVTLLRQLLADHRPLIVLDNVRDSDHVRPILAATGSCAVLVTSRQQLTGLVHRDGAHRIMLPRLARDDSVTLLRRRIGDARAAQDPRAVDDLVSLCDGLPLGIRIAAEHVAGRPDVPLHDLVVQLRRQRRILLDAGSQGDDDTVTLRAVFSCSYDALVPEARRLFRLLGLHPGIEFSAPAASALADLPLARTEQLLDILLGANLVEQRAADRYRLHDLIHLFAAELAAAEDPQTRRATIHRLLDWYLSSAINAARQADPNRVEVPPLPITSGIEPQRFHDAQEALRWAIAERPNLLAAVRYAASEDFHEHAWRLVGDFDDLLHRYGDPRELLEVHHIALESARAVNSKEGAAGLLNNLGFTYYFAKEYTQAARYLREAHLLYRELGDTYGEAMGLMNIATTAIELGELRSVVKMYEKAIALFDRIGHKAMKAHAYHRLGDAYRRMEQYDSAAKCYQTALRLRQELDHPRQADTLTAIGELHLTLGDLMPAMAYLEQALIFHHRALDERRTAEALEALATVYFRLNRFTDAIPRAAEAARLYRAINEPHGQARSLNLLAEAYHAVGDYSAARAHWSNAATLFRELNHPDADMVERRLARMSDADSPIPEPRTTPLTPRAAQPTGTDRPPA
ncbi:MAG TPA: tetratricopeptide repeat protein [Actinophytocola sp.]|uniref:AfsR/SARP family transcriptional regulator n=1 Tax=Actinophytocola sp. TaxID=1872138 RepID=UPI002DDD0185|nr:tetratricopeptide repeat protein [Actinophytocola sp.]HEV2779467.1 tetratricopeptide repeat protein [Actinophytocola sp.]